ncbi:MAG: neuraminidase-like domain-containing protein, partial [Pseudomonadota bacterium]
ELQAVLDSFNLRRVLPEEVAAVLELSLEKLTALASYAGVDFSNEPLISAVAAGDPLLLITALEQVAQPLAAFRPGEVSADSVSFIAANPDVLAPGGATATERVRGMAAYVHALKEAGEEAASAIDAVMLAFTPANGFDAADTEQLAAATGTDAASVRIFAAGTAFPASASLALDTLRRVVGFAMDRQISADGMALLTSADAAALNEGAESLKASLQQRLGDSESFEAAIEGHEDYLRGQRRDALTDFMLRTSAGRFESRQDLYNYYLIDPSMEGCARTSRVVSAIGSVQTYVHRILLNLEQDRRDPDASNHVHVSPSRIPAGEWEWRKNYRVWEANRKVFLWPENYMLPELRDNKTPLFEELEKNLLQQEVNEQTVLDAYAAYLRGFEEVAALRIAGAFHEHVWSEGRDVMHIFGCTADDPPAYYYWNIENLTFSKLRDDRRVVYSARRKIDVAIPVRDVSPTLYRNRLHIFWVEKSTAPWNRVVDGESQFIGYRHTLRLRFSFLRLDGSWTEPQAIEIAEHDGLGGDLRAGGLVRDPLDDRSIISADRIPKFADSSAQHYDYLEGYTLSAPAWQKVYPGVYDGELVIAIGARMFSYRVDMFERKAYRLIGHPLHGPLYGVWGGTRQAMYLRNENQGVYHQAVSRPNTLPYAPPGGRQDYVVSENALRRNIMGFGNRLDFIDFLQDLFNLAEGDLGAAVASVSDPEVRVMAPMSDWGFPAMFVQKETDASLLSQSFDSSGRPYQSRRLGTTVIGDMSRKLFYGGVSELLSKSSQLDFGEKTHLLTSANFRTSLIGRVGVLDYTGPLGAYFRELFMHIPALLAAHQNARGDFAAAQGWYQTIFDPTASFDSSVDLGSLSPSARLQAERDRVWQYAEFQGMSPPTLRDILTDEEAQESYRKDPFNPYAIARLRLSAFQKNIVMRYVDNLLDWADSLFRIFQRETVDEAHILYDLASQILGPRPADVGDCGEGVVRPRTYRGIQPHLEANQEFLIEVENYVIHGARRPASPAGTIAQRRYINVETADVQALELRGRVESRISSEIRFDSARAPDAATRVTEATRGATERKLSDDLTVADLDDELTAAPELPQVSERVAAENRLRDAHAYDGTPGLQMDWHHTDRVHMERAHTRVAGAIDRNWRNWREVRPDRFSFGLVRQVGPVFCVPRNKDLLALWDRVEDGLFKIRNCRNIDGDRVDLALFAPEIDPLALVRARAAGLSLSDILGSLAGNLPPYRFSYLISKAREYTGQVQSFGARLLSAMERRDGEELARLRLTQAINMQNLVTKIRENELKIAEENLAEVQKREEELQYRKEFLEKSISTDLLPWERAEQILKHSAVASKILGAGLKGTAGVFYLLPQIGSPFSMKYGGEEFGHSAKEWGEVFKDTGTMLDLMAKSAGVEAKYEKRRKEWKHALKLEEHQLKQIEKRITAAEIRVSIARRALANHEQSIKDQEELLDFYESKFAGVEFYTWTASTLQSLYRQAFNAAFSMAQLTERAYRFERPSDSAQLLELSYWEPGQAGLLSGEKLAIDLQAMEKRYIETNYRTLEVTQPFSLRELDPAALLALRSTGECSYTIPEFAFDLLYPGHYRRRIRSVHLTLVRESEPFVNVPVTLRLTGSKIRVEPTQDGAAGLSDSQLRHT